MAVLRVVVMASRHASLGPVLQTFHKHVNDEDGKGDIDRVTRTSEQVGKSRRFTNRVSNLLDP
jgi:hypothetical protein